VPHDYERIAGAIGYLEKHQMAQPTLEELADHLHLSPFHTQRLFQRWAGISPKRFLQFLTVEYAKKLLQDSHSLLDTAYETGLSGPSRLHDLFIAAEAVTPGQYKSRGQEVRIAYAFQASPFGPCLLAATNKGLCHLSFTTEVEPKAALSDLRQAWPGAEIHQDTGLLKTYYSVIFPAKIPEEARPLHLHLKGTNFQLKVWQALLRIPEGYVTTYQDVAARVCTTRAARAVGAAVAVNPIAYVIPCHRVIRKLGVFGQYRYGSERKLAMLGWEAARKWGEEG
jgi:AraC family transcriptional regulator, regulatory protein of adaptative response / methylated-DNA-[protein]-cysteine methyltransferase